MRVDHNIKLNIVVWPKFGSQNKTVLCVDRTLFSSRLFSGDASLSVYEKLFSPTAMSFSGWDVSLLWPLFRVLPAWAEKNNNPSSAGSETAASFADSALSSLMSRTKSLLNCLMLQQLEEANLWKWCVVLRLTQAAEGDLPGIV